MIEYKCILHATVNEKPFRLECYPNTPLEEVKSALNAYLNYVDDCIEKAKEMSKETTEEQCEEKECVNE